MCAQMRASKDYCERVATNESRAIFLLRYYHSQGKNSYFLPLSDQEEFQWVSIESFLSSVRLAKSKDKARTYKLNAADKKVVKQKSSEFFELNRVVCGENVCVKDCLCVCVMSYNSTRWRNTLSICF